MRRYALTGVPRGERVAARIAADYLPVETLLQDAPDLLIVTGSNPVEERIEDEPYWADLSDLLTWGSEHVQSHAALVPVRARGPDRVRRDRARQRLTSKCTGVFPQEVDADSPARGRAGAPDHPAPFPHQHGGRGAPARRRISHRGAIRRRRMGRGDPAGRPGPGRARPGPPRVRPFQPAAGVPPRRRRYAQHERDELPVLPLHCVGPEDWAELEQLHEVVIGGKTGS